LRLPGWVATRQARSATRRERSDRAGRRIGRPGFAPLTAGAPQGLLEIHGARSRHDSLLGYEVPKRGVRNEVSGTSRGGLRHLAGRSQRTRARSSWLRLPGGLRETRCLAPREAQHLARRSQRTRTVELAPPAWWVATRQAGSATWTTHLTDTLRLHQP